MYQLVFKKNAIKKLTKLQKKFSQKIVQELKIIATEPYSYKGDWKQMKATDYWRLRVGSYRAICHINDQTIELLVLKVGARGDVYK